MMKESLSHLVRRDQIGSVDAPPIQKGLGVTDGFIPPPHPPFNNKKEKEASLCWAIPHPLGQFPQGIPQWCRAMPEEILRRHRQSSSLGNMVYSLGKCFTNSTGKSFVPHMTCVTLRDCFPPFPRQFYLQSLSTLYPLIFSRCFLGNSWEFLNLRDLWVLRADVHTGSLNHSFNIWKNTTSTLLFHFKH